MSSACNPYARVEQEVIGNLLLEFPNLWPCAAVLDEGCFADPRHRVVWAALVAIASRDGVADLSLTHAELVKTGMVEQAGGIDYLVECSHSAVSGAQFDAQVCELAEQGNKRRWAALVERIGQMCADPLKGTGEIAAEVQKALLYTQSRTAITKPASLCKTLHAAIDDVGERRASHGASGLSTGYSKLDKTVHFRPGNLIILAGRPSMGKTALAVNIAVHVTRSGKPVGLVSLEMPQSDIGQRILSAQSGIPLNELQARDPLTDNQWEQLMRSAGKLESLPLFTADECPSRLDTVLAEIHRLKSEHGCELVILDYLQLIHPVTMPLSQNQWIAFVSQSLKGTAKSLGITLLCLSQLSRAVEERGGNFRPRLSDLRDSGALEQDADVVMFVYRPAVYKEHWKDSVFKDSDTNEDLSPKELETMAKIIVAKNRNGETETINLRWDAQHTQFQNSTPDEPQNEPSSVEEWEETEGSRGNSEYPRH